MNSTEGTDAPPQQPWPHTRGMEAMTTRQHRKSVAHPVIVLRWRGTTVIASDDKPFQNRALEVETFLAAPGKYDMSRQILLPPRRRSTPLVGPRPQSADFPPGHQGSDESSPKK